MWQTFGEYCKRRDHLLGEMAQSRGDPKGIRIQLDDQDRDFIDQAVAKSISAASALRTRYTLLLRDKPGESGPVRFFGSGRRPFVTVNIERTHLKHLQDKLRSLGAVQVAEHGFTPLKDIAPNDAAGYYNAAFGRQNAADILRTGKPIEINYGRSVETNVTLKNGTKTAATGTPGSISMQEPETTRSALVRPVPNDWSASHLRSLFQDQGEAGELLRLPRLPGNKLDFRQVWRAVQTLVGDTRQPGKYILPEVWKLFQDALPEAGETIYSGVLRQLQNFDPSAAENVPEVKQAMMQTTAMILSHPLRGAKAKTGDFLRDVQSLFSDRHQLFKLAMSYTSQGHIRKSLGINTSNTRRREIGGMMTAKPYDLESLGGEDRTTSSDAEMERFQRSYRGSGQRPAGAAMLVRKPTLHPEQARMAQIEAELRRLEPLVQPIINKLDADGWDIRRVSEDDWEMYRRYQQLEKALNRLKGIALVDMDDKNVAAGAQHQFQPQPIRMRRECARSAHGPLLNFAAWCQKREMLHDSAGRTLADRRCGLSQFGPAQVAFGQRGGMV